MLMCRHDAQQNLVYREWQKSPGKVTALDLLETSTVDFILAGDNRSIKFDLEDNILWQFEACKLVYARIQFHLQWI